MNTRQVLWLLVLVFAAHLQRFDSGDGVEDVKQPMRANEGRESQPAVRKLCQSVSRVRLCDPMDCGPPGSSVRGMFQARMLEGVALSFSRGSSPPRDRTGVSFIAGGLSTIWATREAPPVLKSVVYWLVGWLGGWLSPLGPPMSPCMHEHLYQASLLPRLKAVRPLGGDLKTGQWWWKVPPPLLPWGGWAQAWPLRCPQLRLPSSCVSLGGVRLLLNLRTLCLLPDKRIKWKKKNNQKLSPLWGQSQF